MHAFAITRAIENQVYFLSLNRAGQDYGNSLLCYPWMDENAGPLHFKDHDEDFQYIEIDRHRLSDARRDYTFLLDKRDSYDRPLSGTA